MVKRVKQGEKRELCFLGDINCIERFDLVHWVKDAPKRELSFLGDIDSIERKVCPGKLG